MYYFSVFFDGMPSKKRPIEKRFSPFLPILGGRGWGDGGFSPSPLCYNPCMNDSTASPLNCTQCGGALHPDEGQIFLTCPYCGATVYLDPAQVVFHWYLAPTLNPQQAGGELYRWMSGSQTVKDLDKKAQVVGQSFEYFPLWYFLIRQDNRRKGDP